MIQKDSQEIVSIPSEARERIQTLIDNGVFKDLQNFTDTAITQFLKDFDHAKINPAKPLKSVCKFRFYSKSMDDVIDDLMENGVKGHYNIKIVDYCKIIRGNDFAMWHVNFKGSWLCKIIEVDIYEENSHYEDGYTYLLF